MGEVASVYDGTHQTPNYVDKGVMFLSVEDISTLKSEKFISEAVFLEEFKVSPERADILMTRIANIGTTNVVRANEKLAYYVSLALLKTKDSTCAIGLCGCVIHDSEFNSMKVNPIINFAIA